MKYCELVLNTVSKGKKLKKIYFVLLQNNSVIPFSKMPAKAKNYLTGVRLFETNETTTSAELFNWMSNKFNAKELTEVLDWK